MLAFSKVATRKPHLKLRLVAVYFLVKYRIQESLANTR